MASANPPDRWWTGESTVAVVTGSNKGIGLAIVRKLAQEGVATVVLAARDEGRGLQAAEALHAEGLQNVVFHQLDISSAASVTQFVEWIKQTYGGLDILVNNAAVQHLDNAAEHATEAIDTNYFGTINLTEQLLPHLKASPAGARIVNLSSRHAWLMTINDESVRQELMHVTSQDQERINAIANRYKHLCQSGDSAAAGYGEAYSFTKVLGNAYTRILAQQLASRPSTSPVYVNSVDPGAVDTGMWAKFRATIDDATVAELMKQGHIGEKPKSVEDGADSPVWMALFPPGGPTGRFWSDRKEFSFVYGYVE